MSPEECLCRRSNLFATLTTPAAGNSSTSNYPIPSKAGIYSQNVGKLVVCSKLFDAKKNLQLFSVMGQRNMNPGRNIRVGQNG